MSTPTAPKHRLLESIARYSTFCTSSAGARRRQGDLGVDALLRCGCGSRPRDSGRRDIALPSHLLPALQHHLDQHTPLGAEALLFPAAGDPTRHLAPASLYKVFYRARTIAGRPDLRWHDLRHTGAVLAAHTGATLAELMNRLGHSTPQAALRYQHATNDRDTHIAHALSQLATQQQQPRHA